MKRVMVLGTGMAGYGAAHRLREAGVSSTLFDKRTHYGGHTSSFVYEGRYIFDEGPHVSFTGVERVQKIFADAVDGKYETLNTKVNNYWSGHWVKHPAQINLYGLPVPLIVEVIKDFVAAQSAEPGEIANYEQWLRASFGDSFAEKFPMKYTRKYHTTDACNMSLDWIGPRLYRANLDEVLRGALAPATPDVHYISGFRYPTEGGFVSYLRRFMQDSDVRLGHDLVGIDTKRKVLRFRNRVTAEYDRVISSIPLPDLIPLVDEVPNDVVEAARRLACSNVVIVNLVIDRSDLLDAHWTYIYDEDIFFTRLSTPHLQSPRNVPPACGSIQAECYYSKKYRPLDREPADCIQPVIDDLRRIGVIRLEDRILFQNAMHIDYANVIFDLDRAQALSTVHGFLRDVGIEFCGRYGDWAYIWTDESFMSGERAAERALGLV